MAVLLVSFIVSSCASREEATKEDATDKTRDALRELVYSSISDPERAEQVLIVYQEGFEDLQDTMRFRLAYFTTLWKLNWDYHATEDDFNLLFETYDIRREELWEKAFEWDRKLREATTPDEYRTLMSKEKRLAKELL
jgi:hypothetical protein